MHHVTLQGNHYEVGLQYGSALAAEGYFLLERVPFPITEERRAFAQACIPAYQAHFPEILAETAGLARGQGCPERELQAVLLSMYALPPACACSCFAVSAGGKTLLGRNSDFWTALEEENNNVHYSFPGAAYSFTGNTTAFVEMEDGVNNRALAVGLTAVGPVSVKPGLNAGMLVRYLLEKCATTAQALAALKTLPIASAQTLTLADSAGDIAVAECCADGLAVLRPTAERPFVHAVNRFYSAGLSPCQPGGVDDWQAGVRHGTLERALSAHRGRLDPAKARELLAGKNGFLCQYDRSTGRDTVWSVVYDLTGRVLYRAEGNPARCEFQAEPFPT